MLALLILLLIVLAEPIVVEEPLYTPYSAPVSVFIKEVEASPIEPEVEPYGAYSSCMVYLRNRGIVISGMDAADLIPNYFGTPFVGDVAIFHYTNTAHASYVELVYPSGNFEISEANYVSNEYSERLIMLDDPFLIGFLHKL